MAIPLSSLIDRLSEAERLYYKLLLLVGRRMSGKTTTLRSLANEKGWPMINVNLELSERLLDLTSKQRSLRAPRLLGEIVDLHQGEVLLLDNTEILFSTELQQDPLRLLQGLSRNHAVIASWNGEMVDENLVYAVPGHSEYRRYHRPQAIVIPLVNAQSSTEHGLVGLQKAGKETSA